MLTSLPEAFLGRSQRSKLVHETGVFSARLLKRSVKGVRTFVDVMEAAVDGEYAVTFPLVVLSRFDT